jgi:mono/diheme cytochrome c family protein
MRHVLLWPVVVTMICTLGSGALAQQMGDAKQGEELAQGVCAECHAIAAAPGRSPNAKAPSFATVVRTPGMTEMALRVWLQSPHPTMPNLLLTDQQKDDVIAYLMSLKGK